MNKKLMDYFNVVEKPRARGRASLGLLSGIIAGGIAGLMFAPKSGKETRADLKAQAEIGVDKVKETAEKVKDFAQEKVEDVKSSFDKTKEEAKDEVKDSAVKTAEHVEEAAAKAKEELKKF